MKMQLYGEYGFTDEFTSKVLENLVRRSDYTEYLRTEKDESYYIMKKMNINGIVKEMEEELQRQKEKSMFRRRNTKTLKEIDIVVKILHILIADDVIKEEEDIVMFVAKDKEEILNI